jgi:hypothetical protein
VPLDGTPTNHGYQLGALVKNIGPHKYVDGAGLTTDVNNFVSDASTFLSDQSSGLNPGWPHESNALKADIYALGKVCPS